MLPKLSLKQYQDLRAYIEFAKKLQSLGHLEPGKGNLTVRFGKFLVAFPSGVDYDRVTVDDLILVDLSSPLDKELLICLGGEQVPTSEVLMHLLMALAHPEMSWFVHSHKSAIRTFSIKEMDMPNDFYPATYAISADGIIRCVPPLKWGTAELARGVTAACKRAVGCYMGRHGGFAMGRTPLECQCNLSTMDHVAESFIALGGKYKPMTKRQKADAKAAIAAYRAGRQPELPK